MKNMKKVNVISNSENTTTVQVGSWKMIIKTADQCETWSVAKVPNRSTQRSRKAVYIDRLGTCSVKHGNQWLHAVGKKHKVMVYPMVVISDPIEMELMEIFVR